jgi:hypothetical protein
VYLLLRFELRPRFAGCTPNFAAYASCNPHVGGGKVTSLDGLRRCERVGGENLAGLDGLRRCERVRGGKVTSLDGLRRWLHSPFCCLCEL